MGKLLLRGSAMYLENFGSFPDSSLIKYLNITLPPECDSNCGKCCNKELIKKWKSTGDEMTIEEIISAEKEAKESGAEAVVFLGIGEPTVNKKFKEIVWETNNLGLIPYFFTHGRRLTEDYSIFLRENNASIIISVDSLNEKEYEISTGTPGSCDILMENLVRLRDIYKDTKKVKDGNTIVSLGINTVLNLDFLDSLGKIKDFCEDDFAWSVNLPIYRGNASIKSDILYRRILDKIDKKIIMGTTPHGTDSDGIWCLYNKGGVTLFYNGDFEDCPYSHETAGLYGSLKTKSIKEHYKQKMQDIERFYISYPQERCIRRSKNYYEFVRFLKKIRKAK